MEDNSKEIKQEEENIMIELDNLRKNQDLEIKKKF